MDPQEPKNYLDTNLFESGGTLCYHSVTPTGSALRYTVAIGSMTSNKLGIINLTGVLSDKYVIYKDEDENCYEGTLSDGVTVLTLIG